MNSGRIDAADALATGFAEYVVGWALEQAGAPSGAERDEGEGEAGAPMLRILRRAAQLASIATSGGHACALLAEGFDQAGDPGLPQVRDALLRSGAVGTPEVPDARPLILDAAGRLYLHRYFDYERRLAQRLCRERPVRPPVSAAARELLQRLFAPNRAALEGHPDWQQLAAGLALRQPFTIISGGPGTGKTTTVVNLLACLLAQDAACRIALAAPTGKAAARMLEALRARAGHLPPAIQAQLPQQSYTVHRLLGATPQSGVFRHNAGHPLAIDVLVVDEASMLDLALAVKLFEAVPPAARIILLGDKDQLAAVESGAVFAELCADPTLSAGCVAELAALTGTRAECIQPPAPAKPTRMHDSVVWFTENFRFRRDSGIGRLAAGIGAGDPGPVLDWLRQQDGSEVGWRLDGGQELAPATLAAIRDGYAAYLATARRTGTEPAPVFEAFGRFRVLCALRNSARGTEQINARLSQLLRPLLGAANDGSAWYPGRPVIVMRNDYPLRLFNGDIGIALRDQNGELMVYFPEAEGGFRAIAPGRLPVHETAFAMTVHKSQGSEFERVLLVLPAQASRIATRELLYTGVTRARSGAEVAAPAAVLEYAIRTPTMRHSGLLARMEELAAAP